MDDIRVSTAAIPGTALRWYLSAEHIANEWLRLHTVVHGGAQGIDYETLSMAMYNANVATGDYAVASESDEFNRIEVMMRDLMDYAQHSVKNGLHLLDLWCRCRLRTLQVVKVSSEVRRMDALVEEFAVIHGLMRRGGR